MKLIAYLVPALSIISGVFAVEAQKSFLMSFPKNTADHVVKEAKQKIIDAKGFITHEYTLIKGFAASAGEGVFQDLQIWAQSSGATVEEDKVANINKEYA
ncbi:hypothetical protein VMCG_07439 [Cytospora schulzeri]|uniref:Inhibitor I9 domain-containing protein n=1 Tax=Cytospora schulzeri TaxID=448051 RepID=A0A423W2Z6_9PEZI|nr:hypothetical protein VMCG_07439 [Valsa malicola]